jgi:hypothetical protein
METKANYLMIGDLCWASRLCLHLRVWMSNFAGGGKRYVVFDSR